MKNVKKSTATARPAYAVILAGGKGERFWPASTARRPKQLLALTGGKTLLAQAVERLEGLIPPRNIFIITGRELVPAARAAAPALPPAQFIGEPQGRDTAAAIALGAGLVAARDPQASFCVLTADHIIGDRPRFQRTLRAGLALAGRQDVLITIGMPPDHPSTGFGYIEAGARLPGRGGLVIRRVRRFVEKPDRATAARYVASGRYFWNAGMFIWSVPSFERAIVRHRPQLRPLLERARAARTARQLAAVLAAEYPRLEKISVDYALMEKADNLVMLRGAFPWDDVGSWPALERHVGRTADGNTVVGTCERWDARGNIVMSRGRLTALLGVRDLIVVQADGVTLVCAKERAQELKHLVAQLKAAGGRYAKVL